MLAIETDFPPQQVARLINHRLPTAIQMQHGGRDDDSAELIGVN